MSSAEPTLLLALTDDHGAPLAEYFHYPADELLYVRWHGQLNADVVIKGSQQGRNWREAMRYTRVLNDKSDTGGDWREALPWLQYEWLPLALGAGIRAMAYVFSPDRDNRFASQEFINTIRPHMAIELFDDVDTALAWLRTQ
ncbi:hypothetical protein Q5H93_13890 [Hymenobacter sp. ASUV-10]|uniref:STAS/SEC14 domain-containing protein n=1 Tax=Hymenobacter aranciens TaxID=3063996 RepID=A0ABT9BDQ2_9BACT|nr:hypothetical protein [Hymenobacter sp. ASUV-10]MDO7875829.1 hypothetical protein [Hymenobacter sp. ASUV-10]